MDHPISSWLARKRLFCICNSQNMAKCAQLQDYLYWHSNKSCFGDQGMFTLLKIEPKTYQKKGPFLALVNVKNKKNPWLHYTNIPASLSDNRTISSLSLSFCNSSLLSSISKVVLGVSAVGATSELSMQCKRNVKRPMVAIQHRSRMGKRNGARWMMATEAGRP